MQLVETLESDVARLKQDISEVQEELNVIKIDDARYMPHSHMTDTFLEIFACFYHMHIYCLNYYRSLVNAHSFQSFSISEFTIGISDTFIRHSAICRVKTELQAVAAKGKAQHEDGGESAKASKTKKKELEHLAKTLKRQAEAAQQELGGLRECIAKEMTAVASGSVAERWLVIGSNWNDELGKWGNMCGHTCKAGDAWSRRLMDAGRELEQVVERVEREREEVLQKAAASDHREVSRVLASNKKALKAEATQIHEKMSKCSKRKKELIKEQRVAQAELKKTSVGKSPQKPWVATPCVPWPVMEQNLLRQTPDINSTTGLGSAKSWNA